MSPCPPPPYQIVSRYDIILILEVVDVSGESVKTFLDTLNKSVSAFMIIFDVRGTKTHTVLACVHVQIQQGASLHSEDQHSSGPNPLQGAVHVPVQVSERAASRTAAEAKRSGLMTTRRFWFLSASGSSKCCGTITQLFLDPPRSGLQTRSDRASSVEQSLNPELELMHFKKSRKLGSKILFLNLEKKKVF